MTTKTKTFDCVEMKRRGALKVHERLKGMTLDQQIEYWRKRSAAFRAEQGTRDTSRGNR